MSINFILSRIKQFLAFAFLSCVYRIRFHYPNAATFHTPGIDIARKLNRLPGIGSVKGAYMLMLQPSFTTNKYFPQR